MPNDEPADLAIRSDINQPGAVVRKEEELAEVKPDFDRAYVRANR
jgi:hypothetical protein